MRVGDLNGSQLSLRQASVADAEFAYQVLNRTMREYVEGTFGLWSEVEVRAKTFADAAAGRSQVIEFHGQAIGIMTVTRTETHLQLEQLFILPEHQRRGIGTELLEGVLSQARELALAVRLRVLRVNPAKGLYERHGFRVTSEEPARFYMQWAPQA
jgi:ribosomal protein S18 acetylase RimI-like enzyme